MVSWSGPSLPSFLFNSLFLCFLAPMVFMASPRRRQGVQASSQSGHPARHDLPVYGVAKAFARMPHERKAMSAEKKGVGDLRAHGKSGIARAGRERGCGRAGNRARGKEEGLRAGGKSCATAYTPARRAPAVRIDRGKRLAGKERRGHAPLQLQSIEEEREVSGKRGGRRDPARGPGIRRLHASTACCSARPPHASMACSSTRPPIEASPCSSAPPTSAALPSIDSWLAGWLLPLLCLCWRALPSR